MFHLRLIAAIVVLSILSAACGQAAANDLAGERSPTGGGSTNTSQESNTTTTTTPTTTVPVGPRPAETLEDVEQAVVRIVANGTFETPEGEAANRAGSGSGFVIAADGLAVTNNHVVTGAAYLDVYVAGEDEPRTAHVVAVSECSDLALIDIDGQFDRYLTWFDGEIKSSLESYVAGYPLGDPNYTIYDGVIAKAAAAVDTTWASISYEIEHSADAMSGNSGGPIVTEDAQVIAVHYAGNGYGQSYGISVEEARPIVDQLKAGRDVASIGINGKAILLESGFSGIWVASVQSGSPAHQAGVKPGDIVTRLENLDVATDGTMAQYCKILRGHSADDQLSVEVLRLETNEILEGAINGDELEVTRVLDPGEPADDSDDQGQGGSASQYTVVTHNTGALEMAVPTTWTDTAGGAWTIDGEWVGKRLAASTDLEAWNSSWGTAGAQFRASSLLAEHFTPETFLDVLPGWEDCTFAGRDDYDDGMYVGVVNVWTDCAGTNSTLYELAATPTDGSYLVFVEIIETDPQGQPATDKVLNTFMVTGSV